MMKVLDVPLEIAAKFEELIQAFRATSRLEAGGDSESLSLGPSPVFFDMDRVWHTYGYFEKAVELVSTVARSLDSVINFDTIVPIVSSVGTFGPVPLASALALRLHKDMLVLREVDFGGLSLYPLTGSREDLIANRRMLLFKDVIIHAASVKRAVELLRPSAGKGSPVKGLLVLVDQNPQDRRYDFLDSIDDEAYYATICKVQRS